MSNTFYTRHYDLPNDVICNITVYAADTNLCSKCDQTSDLLQQIELASKIECDLRDTMEWCRKWLFDFNVVKTQLVLFGWPSNTGAIDVKINGSVHKEKLSFKMLRLYFSSKLDWYSYIISIAKTAAKEIGALIHS